MTATEVIQCPSCGAKNRVTDEQRSRVPVCGRCKKPLPVDGGGHVRVVTDASFGDEVERSPLPVLLDLWAPWCGPCQMLAPTIEALAAELGSQVRFAKINIDENQRTAARFRVSSIPTLLIINGGREVDRIVGLQEKTKIARRLAPFVR